MPRTVLITGASGRLGAYVVRRLAAECSVVGWSKTWQGSISGVGVSAVDLTDRSAVNLAFDRARPQVLVHAAAVSRVGDARADADLARRVNVEATMWLAELAERSGCRLIYLSTDMVFDGRQGGYVEEDQPRPLSVYGQTKLAAEAPVLATTCGMVLRLSLLFGRSLTGRETFFEQMLQSLRAGRSVRAFDDEWRTPLDCATAAEAIALAVDSDLTGLWHLGGPQRMSRYETAVELAAAIGADAGLVQPVSRSSLDAPEPRPRDTSLDSSKWYSRFPDCPRPRFADSLKNLLAE